MAASQPLEVAGGGSSASLGPAKASTLFQAVTSRSGMMLLNKSGQPEEPAGTTTLQAMSTIVTTIIGAGILGFPRTFAQGGWFWSSLILVACAWLAVEVGTAIDASCNFVQMRLDRGEKFSFASLARYDHLCEVAFGACGRRMAAILVNAQLLMIGSVFIILINYQLAYLIPSISGSNAVLGIAALFMPLSLLDDMTVIANLSVVGVVASVIYAFSIGVAGYQAAQSPCPVEHTYFLPLSELGAIGPVISVFLMGFGYQVVAPQVRGGMQKPREFPKAIVGAVCIVTLVYGTAGGLAYWGWGNSVEAPVVNSMYEYTDTCERGERMALGLLLASAIIANLSVTFPIIMNCVYRAAEAALGVKYSLRGASPLIRIGLVAVVLAIGEYLPYFFPVFTLAGATVGGFVSVFLPLSLYWKLAGDERIPFSAQKGRAARHAVILSLGLVSLIFGTMGAIQEFIDEMEKDG